MEMTHELREALPVEEAWAVLTRHSARRADRHSAHRALHAGHPINGEREVGGLDRHGAIGPGVQRPREGSAVHAVEGRCRVADQEIRDQWGRHGIRVDSVAPGLIDAPIAAGLPGEYREDYGCRTPLGRSGTADDVAKVVRFLLSEESGYVTGQTDMANGGFLTPS